MAQQIIGIYEFFLICLELNFSRSCVEIMIEEQCDSVSLKYASADLEKNRDTFSGGSYDSQ